MTVPRQTRPTMPHVRSNALLASRGYRSFGVMPACFAIRQASSGNFFSVVKCEEQICNIRPAKVRCDPIDA